MHTATRKLTRWTALVLALAACDVSIDPGSQKKDGGPVAGADGAVSPGDAAAQQPADAEAAAPPDASTPVEPPDAAAAVEPPDAAAPAGPDASTIVPSTLGAVLVVDLFPRTLGCQATFDAYATFRNTGSATWLPGEVSLDALSGSDPLTALATQPLPGAVAPGGEHQWAWRLTAPSQNGTFKTEWKVRHAWAGFFGELMSNDVAVSTCGGTKLPLPDASAIVQEVHDANPGLIEQSCQDTGGNWGFMDAVVDRLRQDDARWGYNWKRGVVGDASQDVVDYHWGDDPREGSTNVYIVDIIGGHCGPNPQPAWIDVTQATLDAGTVGMWTGRGRF